MDGFYDKKSVEERSLSKPKKMVKPNNIIQQNNIGGTSKKLRQLRFKLLHANMLKFFQWLQDVLENLKNSI